MSLEDVARTVVCKRLHVYPLVSVDVHLLISHVLLHVMYIWQKTSPEQSYAKDFMRTLWYPSLLIAVHLLILDVLLHVMHIWVLCLC
jgi:hypothetical protein